MIVQQTHLHEPRIRRESKPPRRFAWAEYGLERVPDRRVEIEGLAEMHCVLRVGRWFVDEMEMATRTSVCRLLSGKQIVGFMEFREYNLEGLHPSDAFECMDAISLSACHCAELLIDRFDTDAFLDLFEQGPLLEFATAWRHPKFPNAAIWAAIANHVIDQQFDPAIALLKAFPLEYEHYQGPRMYDQAAEPHALDQPLQRRTAAMIRMYRSRLGFTLAQEPFGEKGWMIKVRREIVDTGTKP